MTTADATRAAAEAPAAGGQDDGARPIVLSVAQVAELLGVSEWLVLQQVRQGTLPHKRCGRRIVFSRQRLLNWLDSE
jgi:excisionase family DNA binding protein